MLGLSGSVSVNQAIASKAQIPAIRRVTRSASDSNRPFAGVGAAALSPVSSLVFAVSSVDSSAVMCFYS